MSDETVLERIQRYNRLCRDHGVDAKHAAEYADLPADMQEAYDYAGQRGLDHMTCMERARKCRVPPEVMISRHMDWGWTYR